MTGYTPAPSDDPTPGEGPICSAEDLTARPVTSCRDGPWETETGEHLAGWEVEIPTRRIFSAVDRGREALVLTELPKGLAKVMGEDEYHEQVVAIRVLMEAHAKKIRHIKLFGMCLGCLTVPFILFSFVFEIPFLVGWVELSAFLSCLAVYVVLMALLLFLVLVLLARAYYRATLAGKTLGYEISRATAHWAARGIAWRLKTSYPIAETSGSGSRRYLSSAFRLRVRATISAPTIRALTSSTGVRRVRS